MIELIFAVKFVHLLAAAAMFGTWLGIAAFMRLAHRSGNASVVALTARFAVRVELTVMAAAVALQPISGFVLAFVIGISPVDEFWIKISLALYGVVVSVWLAALRLEVRIRDLTQQAALDAGPLSARYRRLFRFHTALVWPALAALVALFALMVWQPRAA